jgi:xanthine dehydrogenase accessory factor
MSVRRIIQAFEDWRRNGEPMVLATVYETMGSTYSKAGHRILIATHGDYQGLVSGGCLEGDLAERARKVLSSGIPKAVTYDLRDEADELWGLGVGCNGLLRVFLQPLTAEHAYEPFTSIAAHVMNNAPAAVATVIESKRAERKAG